MMGWRPCLGLEVCETDMTGEAKSGKESVGFID